MNEPKLRVVLDLNVLISAYFFSKPDAPPRLVLEAALNEQFVMLHSEDYRADLVEAFSKEKFIAKLVQLNQTPQSIRDTLSNLGEEVPSQFVPYGIVRDEDDSVILGCAVGDYADYIVSGDNDLTVLESYQNIPIVKPNQFLAILNPPVEERL